ncbi:MAG: hypothetical protein LQ338_002199 [Usnochroma carphineum]|nr:MAG: hypothetical protein LQ338_002199 [Usnochroma carphineum]
MAFQKVSLKAYDGESDSGSMLVQCGSPLELSIPSNGSSELKPFRNPAAVPFDIHIQHVGSHLASSTKRSHVLALSSELDSLSSHTSTPIIDDYPDHEPSLPELYELRHQNLRVVIADVDRLFSDAHHQHRYGAAILPGNHREPTAALGCQKYSGDLPYDMDEQIFAGRLRNVDHRRWNTAWSTTSRIIYLIALAAAIAWHILSIRS